MHGAAPLILIVEDDPDTRGAMADLLEAEGYRAVTARDGVDALLQLESPVLPGVIVTDIHMPRMNGVELCEACARSARLKGIPRIVTTGLADVAGCKADLFVAKPFDPDELLESLADLIAVSGRSAAR